MVKLLQIQALRIPLLISVVLQLGQQLSGINAVSCICVGVQCSLQYVLLEEIVEWHLKTAMFWCKGFCIGKSNNCVCENTE